MKISHFGVLLILVFAGQSCKNDAAKTVAATKINPNEINWMSLEEAEAANKKAPKEVFVMVFAPWCPKCEKFETTTFSDPKVIKEVNTNFYPVKINAQEGKPITFKGKKYENQNFDPSKDYEDNNSYHDILFEIQAKSIPSLVFLDKNLEMVGSELGYKEAGELRSLMRLYGEF